jgi:hypothetical protein
VELDLDPAQPDAVVAAVRELLAAAAAPAPDPWWQAGVEEALEPHDERPDGPSGSA